MAMDEVSHLFSAADDDKNGLLSISEFLENHEYFEESEVLNLDDHLL